CVKVKIKPITKHIPVHLHTILFMLFISLLLSLFFVANTLLEIVTVNIALFLLILILWCAIYLIRERYHHLKAKIKSIPNYLPTSIPILLILLFILLFLPQFFSELGFFRGFRWKYHSSMFFEGSEIHKIILNMGVDYWSSEGILFPLAFIGFVTLLSDVNKNKKYLFLILILLSCTPISVYGEYLTIFLSPLFAILVGLGMRRIIGKLNGIWSNRLSTSFVVICVIISVLFSSFMPNHWVFSINPRTKTTQWMQDRTYHVTLFLDNREGSVIVGGTGFEGQIAAFLLVNRIVWPGWGIMLGKSYDNAESQEVISKYNVKYSVENENTPGDLTEYWSGRRSSKFLKSVRKVKDKIYDNGLQGIWSLE
ncbi:MAG: hypothetical protein KAX49_20600, partial [Halanaerobiales bacterium]|nr:hypothetical protein [Halanaerobiales bacterium]